METYKEIERSIIKKFRPAIWSKFMRAIKDYNLISPGDKIAVCISGGKDSALLAKCMEEVQKHGNVKFELEYIVMDPGYTKEILDKIKENLKILNIDAHIFRTEIFKIADISKAKSPCFLCARMRRGYLYNFAKNLGCNKIALGHHYDDVLATILLNLTYNGSFGGMRPKLHSDHFVGMELIRPLFLVREDDIIEWARYNDLTFIGCACSVTRKSSGKRLLMKNMIEDLKKYNPDIEKSLFSSINNINLNTVLSYNKDGERYNFLDDYDK